MQAVDLMISARWIIAGPDVDQILENHSLLINDGKIHAIIPTPAAEKSYQAKATKMLDKHVLLPGFINAHTHLPMNLFRGLADDLSLMDWLKLHIWPAEEKWVSESMVSDGSKLAMAEMIRGGTTCFNDMYFFIDATAKALIESGMRGGIGMTVINVPTAWAKTPDEYFQKSLAFYQEYKNHERIIPTLAPHSTYMVNPEDLLRIKDLQGEMKVKMNIHLQEAPTEITQAIATYHQRPLQRLYDMGLVSSDLIAIHMTQIDERDLEIIKEKKPSIVHCPESNMKTLSGCCPVEQLLNLGINVALGTDGAASNNDLDMIGEMRSAALLGKIVADDARAVSASRVLKMATINGAKALGIDHVTGSLEVGKAADCVAFDLSCIETQPTYNPISQIVYAGNRFQITDVWVNGKQLLQDRVLTTLDEDALITKTQYWREKIKF